MQAEINNQVIQLSEAGWLENLDEWSEELAVEIAKNEQIPELTEEHWDIVQTAREYFKEYSTVAEPRMFSKIMKKKFGDDRSSQKYIYSLFPTGLIKCANKVAGLPRPKGCS
ncbi:MAG: TusE/DsrC/DsvC family sulfur relay protein [Gammaproteobacteria bacterium]|nr:MAG: TusE/DsrC/DsvC family sulfur relay protein [Gammaproteobacteria bacterium]